MFYTIEIRVNDQFVTREQADSYPEAVTKGQALADEFQTDALIYVEFDNGALN